MLHLSLLYQIDQGFNNWDVKMYWFWQFCMWFPVLITFFSVFSFWMIFLCLQFLIGPNAPLYNLLKLQNFQSKFAIRTMAYGYSRTKKKLPVNTVSEIATTVIIMFCWINAYSRGICLRQRSWTTNNLNWFYKTDVVIWGRLTDNKE